MQIKEFLSPTARKVAYTVFAILGVGFGATQTAYSTAEVEAPLWLTVAFAVYLYVGGAFGLVAATNVAPQVEVHQYDEPDYEGVALELAQEVPEELDDDIQDATGFDEVGQPRGRYAE